jgi:hypothetical protein
MACLKIKDIKQGHESVDDYIIHFEEYEGFTSFDDTTLMESFKEVLTPSILSCCYGLETVPVMNLSQCPSNKPNPTPNPMTTSSITPATRTTPRVTILSQTPKDQQMMLMDDLHGPTDYQSGTDEN